VSVTTVFQRFHDDALTCWLNDRESFDERSHPDCDSIQLGVENVAVANLLARARNKKPCALHEDPLFQMIVGVVGTSVYDDGDYPRIISAEDVASASRMMDAVSHDDLRAVCDIDRLKRDCGEIEDTRWDLLGPNVLEDDLIPMFEQIRRFFHRAAEGKQKMVVSWF
jgi:hypothetical protein